MPTGRNPKVISQTQSGEEIVATDPTIMGAGRCHQTLPPLLGCSLHQRASLISLLLCIISSPFGASVWKNVSPMSKPWQQRSLGTWVPGDFCSRMWVGSLTKTQFPKYGKELQILVQPKLCKWPLHGTWSPCPAGTYKLTGEKIHTNDHGI